MAFVRRGCSMDLRYLQTFKTITQEGSFTKAAVKLNYTQSTITFHMEQLEKEIGVDLFQKVGRRMVLTKAGEEFAPYVEEVLSSLDKLSNFQSNLGESRGTLRLGATESLLCFRLPYLLKEFHERAPKVHLLLRSMNSINLQHALKEDRIDIGVFYKNHEAEEGITWHEAKSHPLSFFSSPRIKREYPDFLTPHKKYPHLLAILQPLPGMLRQKFDEYVTKKDITLDNTIEVRSTQTIINLATNDMGICYLPRFVVREAVKQGQLVEFSNEKDFDSIGVAYGYRKGKWMSPAMKLFLEILKEHETKNNDHG